jgi:hypothetical protein
MPVSLWWKIQNSNDLLHLIKGTKTTSKRIIKSASKRWYDLNSEFTDFFGIPKRQKKYLKLLAKHQIYVSAYARTKSHRWTTKRLYIEIELEQYKPKESKEKFNPYEELRNVSMSLSGAHIDPNTMSVIQYYSDKDLAIKNNKKAKQAQNKR